MIGALQNIQILLAFLSYLKQRSCLQNEFSDFITI